MIIKKFQAKTEEEAVSAAKREMGENVVIMSTRSLKKRGFLSFLAKPVMEVTVGMEEESEKPASNAFSMLAKQSVAREGINRGMVPSRHVLYDDEEPVKEEPDKRKLLNRDLIISSRFLKSSLQRHPNRTSLSRRRMTILP